MDKSCTVRAIAIGIDGNCISSEATAATYVIKAATPTFDPAEGTYYETQNVTISTTTEGAKIYYTTNGDEPTASSTLYTEAITVSKTTTIKAIAINGEIKSDVAEATYTIAEKPNYIYWETFGNSTSNEAMADGETYTATASMFTDASASVVSHYSGTGRLGKNTTNPSSGYTYGDGQTASGNSAIWQQATKNTTTTLFQVSDINIEGCDNLNLSFGLYYQTGSTLSDNKVTVQYSIDGGEKQELSFTQPSMQTWDVCSGTIDGTGSSLTLYFTHTVTGGHTARIDDIYLTGSESAAVKVPVITPGTGTYCNDTTVTITCATDGAVIYYTTDDSDPSATNGTKYSEKIKVSDDCTIKAIAVVGEGEKQQVSKIATATYTFAVATPVITPASSACSEPQSVTITCATKGATIYYTTNGDEPTADNGTEYKGAFTVSTSTTVKAIAVKGTWKNSDVASATYTFKDYLTIKQWNETVSAGETMTNGLGKLTVLAAYGPRIFVKDATGYMYIYSYDEGGKYQNTYKRGDVIAPGTNGTKKAYGDEYDLTDATVAATTGETEDVQPRVITLSNGGLSHQTVYNLLTVEGVSLTSKPTSNRNPGILTDQGGSKVYYYCNMGVDEPSDYSGKLYDVDGCVINYPSDDYGNVYELLIVEWREHVAATEVTLDKLASEGVARTNYKVTGTDLKSVGHFTSQNGETYIVVCDNVQSVHNYVDVTTEDVKAAEDKLKKDHGLDQSAYPQVNWMVVRVQSEADYAKYQNNIKSISGTLTDDYNLTFDGTAVELANEDVVETTLNTYTPVNMMSLNPIVKPEQTMVGRTQNFFFMTPKRSEMVKTIWMVYGGSSQFYVPSDWTYNPNKLKGGVQVRWDYNEAGDISANLKVGETYQITAIVKELATQSEADAPKKATAYTEGGLSEQFEVYPINLTASTIVTGVTEVVAGSREVQSVRYYDLTGRTSLQPFEGINVVVTTYTDGSHTTAKVVK